MRKCKVTLLAVALLTAASATATPSYADSEVKPAAKPESAAPQPTKSDCSKAELAAFVVAEKARHAAKLAEVAKKPGTHFRADDPGDAAAAKAEKAAPAAKAAAKAKEHAARAKAHAVKKAAHACAMAKHEAAKKAKRDAHKALAAKFNAVGVVATHDLEAGTVTVFIKAGSPDLRSRKLAIKVPAESVVKLDGAKASLSALISGTFVTVHGTRSGDTLVAGAINAVSPIVVEAEEVPTGSPAASAATEEF